MKKSLRKRRQETAPVSQNYLLYRFNYERYTLLRPVLRLACFFEDFEVYCTSLELEAALTAWEEEQVTIEILRQEIVRAECCLDEPLALDAGFVRFVRELAHRPYTDMVALLLSELIAGNKNIESWFRADAGLIGILTPEETRRLAADLQPLFQRGSLGSRKGRKKRRGGLLGKVRSLMRGFFASSPSEDEMLVLLADLLQDAVRESQGLALSR